MKIKLKNTPKSPAVMCEKCGLFWALQGYNLCPKCADISAGKYHSAKQTISAQYGHYYTEPNTGTKFYCAGNPLTHRGAESKTGWSFVNHLWSMGLFLNILNAGSMNKTPKIPHKTHKQLCLDTGYTEWHFACFENFYGLKIGTTLPTIQ
jgi:hypothetical protein